MPEGRNGPAPCISYGDIRATPPSDEIPLLPPLSGLSSEKYLQSFAGIYNSLCSPRRGLNRCRSLLPIKCVHSLMSADMEKRRKNVPNVANKKRNPSPPFCLRTHRMTKNQSLIPSPTVARSYAPQQLASTSLDALDRDRQCGSSSLSSSAPPPVPPPLHLLGLISGPLKQTVFQIAVEYTTGSWRARECYRSID